MVNRVEELPEDAKNHYKVRPRFPHSRWYALKELKKLIELARDKYILKVNSIDNIQLADFGCGTKPYLSLFDSNKISYLGIDLPWNPHADVIIDINSKIEAPDESYDVILSTQVLEHVDDPKSYL